VLAWLPLRSRIARGASYGVGAHGAGTARAHQIGREEGAVAGLVMVLVGLMNVALAPVIIQFVH
jgi:putative effector of murein hydrolase